MQTSPLLVALPLFPAVLWFNEPEPVLWRRQLTGIGPMGGFKNCLSCSSVQCSAFCKVFLWGGGHRRRRSPRPCIRGPSSKLLPFLTCKVLLLPFPSCPCAAKPLSNPLERGCNYCFLAHLGNNPENQTFFSQARPGTLGCWWRKLSGGCIISCPSELSWVNKELCFGVVLHYRSSGTI